MRNNLCQNAGGYIRIDSGTVDAIHAADTVSFSPAISLSNSSIISSMYRATFTSRRDLKVAWALRSGRVSVAQHHSKRKMFGRQHVGFIDRMCVIHTA